MHEHDKKYMRRALQLASYGAGHVSPNPMVGAVIVAPDGRIIGEGFHRRYGEAHAEVNAVRSISAEDSGLLTESTIYVTLEPCSHYGKTPPCAAMLCELHVKRVVIGTGDPNPKVSGRTLFHSPDETPTLDIAQVGGDRRRPHGKSRRHTLGHILSIDTGPDARRTREMRLDYCRNQYPALRQSFIIHPVMAGRQSEACNV